MPASIVMGSEPGAARVTWSTRAFRRLLRLAQSNPCGIAVGIALLLGLGDFLTGIDVTFTLLYILPISIAAWWRGRSLGFAVATLCVAIATVTEIVGRIHRGWHLHPWTMAWNHGGSLALFALVVLLLVRVHAYADEGSRERRATVAQLRQAERLGVLGRLASGLAHELGTPLNVIAGHAELLDSDGATRSMIHGSSTTILAQTEKMTTIIRGLLDFSRRAGEDKSDVNLAALARAAATLVRPVASKKAIDLVVDAAHQEGVTVHANRTELEQVLVNLIMNGIQAMSSGGTLRVRVRTPRVHDPEPHRSAPPPSSACVEVEDDGSGIAPENLAKIFDPFFTTKDVGEGTGLGLSVSYGIVSDHGGRIEVASALGSGSRFSVYLPLAKAPR